MEVKTVYGSKVLVRILSEENEESLVVNLSESLPDKGQIVRLGMMSIYGQWFVEEGEKILFNKQNRGIPVKVNDEELLLLPEDDINFSYE